MSTIYLPSNIFTNIIADAMPKSMLAKIKFMPSALISKLVEQEDAIGLIPTLDLIKHNDLYVSNSVGLSFDGVLSNSFIYFKPGENEVDKVLLSGDVSSIESLTAKILFSELYNIEVEVSLSNLNADRIIENTILVGDENFQSDIYVTGLSFAEEMVELISAPYVNFIFASKSDTLLSEFNTSMKGISDNFYSLGEEGNFNLKIKETAKDFIIENFNSCVVEFEEQDIEGINQLIRIPYFHGLVENIIEPKFI
jgi:hypothetical protein